MSDFNSIQTKIALLFNSFTTESPVVQLDRGKEIVKLLTEQLGVLSFQYLSSSEKILTTLKSELCMESLTQYFSEALLYFIKMLLEKGENTILKEIFNEESFRSTLLSTFETMIHRFGNENREKNNALLFPKKIKKRKNYEYIKQNISDYCSGENHEIEFLLLNFSKIYCWFLDAIILLKFNEIECCIQGDPVFVQIATKNKLFNYLLSVQKYLSLVTNQSQLLRDELCDYIVANSRRLLYYCQLIRRSNICSLSIIAGQAKLLDWMPRTYVGDSIAIKCAYLIEITQQHLLIGKLDLLINFFNKKAQYVEDLKSYIINEGDRKTEKDSYMQFLLQWRSVKLLLDYYNDSINERRYIEEVRELCASQDEFSLSVIEKRPSSLTPLSAAVEKNTASPKKIAKPDDASSKESRENIIFLQVFLESAIILHKLIQKQTTIPTKQPKFQTLITEFFSSCKIITSLRDCLQQWEATINELMETYATICCKKKELLVKQDEAPSPTKTIKNLDTKKPATGVISIDKKNLSLEQLETKVKECQNQLFNLMVEIPTLMDQCPLQIACFFFDSFMQLREYEFAKKIDVLVGLLMKWHTVMEKQVIDLKTIYFPHSFVVAISQQFQKQDNINPKDFLHLDSCFTSFLNATFSKTPGYSNWKVCSNGMRYEINNPNTDPSYLHSYLICEESDSLKTLNKFIIEELPVKMEYNYDETLGINTLSVIEERIKVISQMGTKMMNELLKKIPPRQGIFDMKVVYSSDSCATFEKGIDLRGIQKLYWKRYYSPIACAYDNYRYSILFESEIRSAKHYSKEKLKRWNDEQLRFREHLVDTLNSNDKRENEEVVLGDIVDLAAEDYSLVQKGILLNDDLERRMLASIFKKLSPSHHKNALHIIPLLPTALPMLEGKTNRKYYNAYLCYIQLSNIGYEFPNFLSEGSNKLDDLGNELDNNVLDEEEKLKQKNPADFVLSHFSPVLRIWIESSSKLQTNSVWDYRWQCFNISKKELFWSMVPGDSISGNRILYLKHKDGARYVISLQTQLLNNASLKCYLELLEVFNKLSIQGIKELLLSEIAVGRENEKQKHNSAASNQTQEEEREKRRLLISCLKIATSNIEFLYNTSSGIMEESKNFCCVELIKVYTDLINTYLLSLYQSILDIKYYSQDNINLKEITPSELLCSLNNLSHAIILLPLKFASDFSTLALPEQTILAVLSFCQVVQGLCFSNDKRIQILEVYHQLVKKALCSILRPSKLLPLAWIISAEPSQFSQLAKEFEDSFVNQKTSGRISGQFTLPVEEAKSAHHINKEKRETTVGYLYSSNVEMEKHISTRKNDFYYSTEDYSKAPMLDCLISTYRFHFVRSFELLIERELIRELNQPFQNKNVRTKNEAYLVPKLPTRVEDFEERDRKISAMKAVQAKYFSTMCTNVYLQITVILSLICVSTKKNDLFSNIQTLIEKAAEDERLRYKTWIRNTLLCERNMLEEFYDISDENSSSKKKKIITLRTPCPRLVSMTDSFASFLMPVLPIKSLQRRISNIYDATKETRQSSELVFEDEREKENDKICFFNLKISCEQELNQQLILHSKLRIPENEIVTLNCLSEANLYSVTLKHCDDNRLAEMIRNYCVSENGTEGDYSAVEFRIIPSEKMSLRLVTPISLTYLYIKLLYFAAIYNNAEHVLITSKAIKLRLNLIHDSATNNDWYISAESIKNNMEVSADTWQLLAETICTLFEMSVKELPTHCFHRGKNSRAHDKVILAVQHWRALCTSMVISKLFNNNKLQNRIIRLYINGERIFHKGSMFAISESSVLISLLGNLNKQDLSMSLSDCTIINAYLSSALKTFSRDNLLDSFNKEEFKPALWSGGVCANDYPNSFNDPSYGKTLELMLGNLVEYLIMNILFHSENYMPNYDEILKRALNIYSNVALRDYYNISSSRGIDYYCKDGTKGFIQKEDAAGNLDATLVAQELYSLIEGLCNRIAQFCKNKNVTSFEAVALLDFLFGSRTELVKYTNLFSCLLSFTLSAIHFFPCPLAPASENKQIITDAIYGQGEMHSTVLWSEKLKHSFSIRILSAIRHLDEEALNNTLKRVSDEILQYSSTTNENSNFLLKYLFYKVEKELEQSMNIVVIPLSLAEVDNPKTEIGNKVSQGENQVKQKIDSITSVEENTLQHGEVESTIPLIESVDIIGSLTKTLNVPLILNLLQAECSLLYDKILRESSSFFSYINPEVDIFFDPWLISNYYDAKHNEISPQTQDDPIYLHLQNIAGRADVMQPIRLQWESGAMFNKGNMTVQKGKAEKKLTVETTAEEKYAKYCMEALELLDVAEKKMLYNSCLLFESLSSAILLAVCNKSIEAATSSFLMAYSALRQLGITPKYLFLKRNQMAFTREEATAGTFDEKKKKPSTINEKTIPLKENDTVYQQFIKRISTAMSDTYSSDALSQDDVVKSSTSSKLKGIDKKATSLPKDTSPIKIRNIITSLKSIAFAICDVLSHISQIKVVRESSSLTVNEVLPLLHESTFVFSLENSQGEYLINENFENIRSEVAYNTSITNKNEVTGGDIKIDESYFDKNAACSFIVFVCQILVEEERWETIVALVRKFIRSSRGEFSSQLLVFAEIAIDKVKGKLQSTYQSLENLMITCKKELEVGKSKLHKKKIRELILKNEKSEYDILYEQRVDKLGKLLRQNYSVASKIEALVVWINEKSQASQPSINKKWIQYAHSQLQIVLLKIWNNHHITYGAASDPYKVDILGSLDKIKNNNNIQETNILELFKCESQKSPPSEIKDQSIREMLKHNIKSYEQAYSYASTMLDTNDIVTSLYTLGSLHYFLGEMEKATKYWYQLLDELFSFSQIIANWEGDCGKSLENHVKLPVNSQEGIESIFIACLALYRLGQISNVDSSYAHRQITYSEMINFLSYILVNRIPGYHYYPHLLNNSPSMKQFSEMELMQNIYSYETKNQSNTNSYDRLLCMPNEWRGSILNFNNSRVSLFSTSLYGEALLWAAKTSMSHNSQEIVTAADSYVSEVSSIKSLPTVLISEYLFSHIDPNVALLINSRIIKVNCFIQCNLLDYAHQELVNLFSGAFMPKSCENMNGVIDMDSSLQLLCAVLPVSTTVWRLENEEKPSAKNNKVTNATGMSYYDYYESLKKDTWNSSLPPSDPHNIEAMKKARLMKPAPFVAALYGEEIVYRLNLLLCQFIFACAQQLPFTVTRLPTQVPPTQKTGKSDPQLTNKDNLANAIGRQDNFSLLRAESLQIVSTIGVNILNETSLIKLQSPKNITSLKKGMENEVLDAYSASSSHSKLFTQNYIEIACSAAIITALAYRTNGQLKQALSVINSYFQDLNTLRLIFETSKSQQESGAIGKLLMQPTSDLIEKDSKASAFIYNILPSCSLLFSLQSLRLQVLLELNLLEECQTEVNNSLLLCSINATTSEQDANLVNVRNMNMYCTIKLLCANICLLEGNYDDAVNQILPFSKKIGEKRHIWNSSNHMHQAHIELLCNIINRYASELSTASWGLILENVKTNILEQLSLTIPVQGVNIKALKAVSRNTPASVQFLSTRDTESSFDEYYSKPKLIKSKKGLAEVGVVTVQATEETPKLKESLEVLKNKEKWANNLDWFGMSKAKEAKILHSIVTEYLLRLVLKDNFSRQCPATHGPIIKNPAELEIKAQSIEHCFAEWMEQFPKMKLSYYEDSLLRMQRAGDCFSEETLDKVNVKIVTHDYFVIQGEVETVLFSTFGEDKRVPSMNFKYYNSGFLQNIINIMSLEGKLIKYQSCFNSPSPLQYLIRRINEKYKGKSISDTAYYYYGIAKQYAKSSSYAYQFLSSYLSAKLQFLLGDLESSYKYIKDYELSQKEKCRSITASPLSPAGAFIFLRTQFPLLNVPIPSLESLRAVTNTIYQYLTIKAPLQWQSRLPCLNQYIEWCLAYAKIVSFNSHTIRFAAGIKSLAPVFLKKLKQKKSTPLDSLYFLQELKSVHKSILINNAIDIDLKEKIKLMCDEEKVGKNILASSPKKTKDAIPLVITTKNANKLESALEVMLLKYLRAVMKKIIGHISAMRGDIDKYSSAIGKLDIGGGEYASDTLRSKFERELKEVFIAQGQDSASIALPSQMSLSTQQHVAHYFTLANESHMRVVDIDAKESILYNYSLQLSKSLPNFLESSLTLCDNILFEKLNKESDNEGKINILIWPLQQELNKEKLLLLSTDIIQCIPKDLGIEEAVLDFKCSLERISSYEIEMESEKRKELKLKIQRAIELIGEYEGKKDMHNIESEYDISSKIQLLRLDVDALLYETLLLLSQSECSFSCYQHEKEAYEELDRNIQREIIREEQRVPVHNKVPQEVSLNKEPIKLEKLWNSRAFYNEFWRQELWESKKLNSEKEDNNDKKKAENTKALPRAKTPMLKEKGSNGMEENSEYTLLEKEFENNKITTVLAVLKALEQCCACTPATIYISRNLFSLLSLVSSKSLVMQKIVDTPIQ